MKNLICMAILAALAGFISSCASQARPVVETEPTETEPAETETEQEVPELKTTDVMNLPAEFWVETGLTQSTTETAVWVEENGTKWEVVFEQNADFSDEALLIVSAHAPHPLGGKIVKNDGTEYPIIGLENTYLKGEHSKVYEIFLDVDTTNPDSPEQEDGF